MTELMRAPAEPAYTDLVPPRPPTPARVENSIGGGENSHVIDSTPIDIPIAIEDPHTDRNTAQTITGAIKNLFRAAVKAMLRRAEASPQPKRSRKGETEGEFRRLARRCSHRTDMRQEFRQRASITSRFLAIPADVFAMATAHLADTLISLVDNIDSGYEEASVTFREDIFPQP